MRRCILRRLFSFLRGGAPPVGKISLFEGGTDIPLEEGDRVPPHPLQCCALLVGRGRSVLFVAIYLVLQAEGCVVT